MRPRHFTFGRRYHHALHTDNRRARYYFWHSWCRWYAHKMEALWTPVLR